MPEEKNKNRNKSFEIKGYNNGDENAICALFERVFGKPMGKTESIRHWQWEFLQNPVSSLFIKLAWDGDKLVGQYTASPVQMYVKGSNITAALSHDTMTDPQYSGLGIFRATAEALYREQTDAGQRFIYGFPNRNSIHGFEKYLKWQQIMPAPVHIRPVCIFKNIFQKIFHSTPGSSAASESAFQDASSLLSGKSGKYKLHVETEFGDWADDLWVRCSNQHRLWVVRNKAYLNWRYVDKPENKYHIVSVWQDYQPVGYVVIACNNMNFGDTIFIMDFLVDLNFKYAADVLIRYVVNVAKKNECAFASVLLTPGSKYLNIFRKKLFLPLPQFLFPQPLYFGARCFDQTMEQLVNDPKAWHISWGDNDVI
jgi:hypothetical protein